MKPAYIFVKYLLKHASNVSQPLKYQQHTGAPHIGCARCIFNTASRGWSQCVSQADTLTLGRDKFYRQLQWSVAMATASLPLVSALSLSLSPLCLHEPLSRGQSLTLLSRVSNPVTPLTPSPPGPPFAYLKLISLAASGSARTLSTPARLHSTSGEMKTDSRWHQGRQDADALM